MRCFTIIHGVNMTFIFIQTHRQWSSTQGSWLEYIHGRGKVTDYYCCRCLCGDVTELMTVNLTQNDDFTTCAGQPTTNDIFFLNHFNCHRFSIITTQTVTIVVVIICDISFVPSTVLYHYFYYYNKHIDPIALIV